MDKPKKIIDLFEENELNVGMLYKLYAQKIPGHNHFWLTLSMEEAAHAADIRSVYRKKSDDLFKENAFSRSVLKYVMNFVQEKIAEAKQNAVSHRDALNTALRIEQSILEKKCFDFFLPTNEKLVNVFSRLNKETERHVARLRKELKHQK